VLPVVSTAAFWATTLGQVSAEWCLYLLITASPLYLHDVSHLSLHNYVVSNSTSNCNSHDIVYG